MKILALLFLFLFSFGCREKIVATQLFPDLEKYSEYEDFLSEVTKITLFSTKSIPYHPDDGPKPKTLFHDYEVMGAVDITNKETISKMLEAVKDNINDESGESYTMCFDPRHGLRIESRDSVKDFLICFECSHLYVYADADSEEYTRIGLKFPSDNSYFNSILDNNNIPRKKPDKSK